MNPQNDPIRSFYSFWRSDLIDFSWFWFDSNRRNTYHFIPITDLLRIYFLSHKKNIHLKSKFLDRIELCARFFCLHISCFYHILIVCFIFQRSILSIEKLFHMIHSTFLVWLKKLISKKTILSGSDDETCE